MKIIRISNTYNADGYRVIKDINGEQTYYLYEGDKVGLETDEDGKQTARNIYGINLLMRTVDNQTYYYMYNGHADVTALIDADGNVAASYYYDAFGNILESSGDVDNNIRYSGYQYDEEIGLYYLNARMYDPETARFMQEDTYTGDMNDPLSLNLYTYCSNNPIIYSDPSGHVVVEATVIYLVYATGVVAVATLGYLYSPQGQEAIHEGATAIKEGVIIAGKATTKAAKATVAAIMYVKPWATEKVIEGAKWVGGIAVDGVQLVGGIVFGGQHTGCSKDVFKNAVKVKGASKTNKKGVGGKGWRGDKTWKQNVKKVGEGGTIKDLNGQVPTQEEAEALIKEAGGKVNRVDGPHESPNPHNYNHINYTTPSGGKGTIRIK